MSGIVIDGHTIALEMIEQLRAVHSTRQFGALAVVGVGATPSSISFLRQIRQAASTFGIVVRRTLFRASVSSERFMTLLRELGNDLSVGGIVVLDGLPFSIDRRLVAVTLNPRKDPDCISEENLGRVANFRYRLVPPAVIAMHEVLLRAARGVPISGNVVIVGAGRRIGRPIIEWIAGGSTVSTLTVLRRASTIGARIHALRHADVLIGAASCAGVLGGYCVKPGVIVIDFGHPPNCDAAQLARLGATVFAHTGPVVVAALLRNFITLNTS